MDTKRFEITLTARTGLLMHSDNLPWSESVDKWTRVPANKAASVPGDDRCPAWRWIGCLYHDTNDLVVIPSDNLMTMFREAGSKVPTGKKGGSFKSITQAGITVDEFGWPVEVQDSTGKYHSINIGPLRALPDKEHDFSKHEEIARKLGFELFVKRASIGNSKHVRVRPRFENWRATGTVTISDNGMTKDILESILSIGGHYCGLCDWRPSSKKSGSWGRFEASIKEV